MFFLIIFGHERKEESEKQEHTNDAECTQSFVEWDDVAHYSFDRSVTDVDSGQIVDHASEETEDTDAEGGRHGD
jgi:hypothetical protein